MSKIETCDYIRGLIEAILKDGTKEDIKEVLSYLADKDLEIINREQK
jgi:hypothetical protein